MAPSGSGIRNDGVSPSARGLPAIPADPAEHAVRFAREWQDVAEIYVQRRMRELGIPEDRIGAIEYAEGSVRRAFDPDRRAGGTCDEFGRLYVAQADCGRGEASARAMSSSVRIFASSVRRYTDSLRPTNECMGIISTAVTSSP
jgi:hypothetical protein